jgi:hypothetical protein
MHRTASLDEFLRSTDSFCSFSFESHLAAPIFADRLDKQIFYDFNNGIVGPSNDKITYVPRSDQYVSMLRCSEGCIFDLFGVSRGRGHLKVSPVQAWLSRDKDGTWISEDAVAAAGRYDKSCLIFYNGNLQNYYHWMVESLLPLNVLSRAMGLGSNLHIALPRSRHIAEVFNIAFRSAPWGSTDITSRRSQPTLSKSARPFGSKAMSSSRCRHHA